MTEQEQSQLAVLDAHCHIDLFADPKAVVEKAESMHIRTIAVTNAPSVFFYTRQLTQNCRYVRPAAGLHPELVHSHGNELEQLWPLLKQTNYVGEVGLDYVSPDKQNRERQRQVFAAIVEQCARLGNKVLTIHSRRAAADVISTIGPNFHGKAILHWYSGSLRDLERAVEYGFYFSVNPAMTLSQNGNKIISAMPPERVLTETDGPFVKLEARPATPVDTSTVILALASTWRAEPEEAKSIVLNNFRSLFDAKSDALP
ncbi:hypothetical protein B7486_07665 [cyanobacterium TDX16]|nr:hypothetical protein B7486_07665 [cyanobacterium TDX16]